MREQLVWHGLRRDDGVAPGVRGDPLGEQLYADPVRLAGDRVDPQAVTHGAAPESAGSGSTGSRQACGQGPDAACLRRSRSKARKFEL